MKIQTGKPFIEQAEINAVTEALRSGWLTAGPRVKEFENKFAGEIGTKHAIAMNSCTSALFLAVKALGIEGEVIMPSFTFVATANAVVTAGAKPVFVDVEYDTCNMDPACIEGAITGKTEAIMPVHFAGHPCEMTHIVRIAQKHNLAIIEDAAETLGGWCHAKVAGSFGIGCFSFFPTKNMTTGEGGMLTTNDDNLAAKIRALVGHGLMKTPYERESEKRPWYRQAVWPGYNFRMSDILGALGLEQLKRLPWMTCERRAWVNYMCVGLRDVEEIDLPVERKGFRHVFQMFTIKVKPPVNRDKFVLALREKGVMAMVHFDPPLHHQEIFLQDVRLPVTNKLAETIVTLPLFPGMNQEQADYVVKMVKETIREG